MISTPRKRPEGALRAEADRFRGLCQRNLATLPPAQDGKA
jgi:hypothetical protein